ncbi:MULTISPECIES: ABC transporter substrate-binding protein [Fusobacterium]|uniref:ABC transporter substrate-binding protein n=1 Tax=Fusobacterium TaxID=848 RepID=UPI001F503ABC|nr:MULTISPECIES: ABC transporter substrate-binding protein [Fusobacterium]MCI5725408.1 ABC transporter substrate-binding protein [Fusobacterium sp.]MDD7391737.1 ABC transporter substrate-binding protein [Fusobacteriaceae bacterium]MDY5305206.1 ABC transporter substrate-binding protein [Fusobacterium gastrosuis]
MKRRILFFITFIFCLLIFTACGGKTDNKTGEVKKDTLIIAQGSDAKTLDPYSSNDSASTRVTMQIFDPLMKLDKNANPIPCLAESWERPDGNTIIFHIKKGVKFHNGDEMKASDVKFSLERALSSPIMHEVVKGISSVELIDDYTVKVTTEKPMAAILNNLSHDNIVVLSEKLTKEAGDSFGRNPVGTGPYKFVSWESGDRITLEAFPDYWRGEAPVKNVVFRNIVEETNRTIGLETGELDIIYDVSIMDKNKIRGDKNFTLIEAPQARTEYLGFNLKKTPFNNPKVREAISYAIDQKAIIDTVYLGSAEAATSIIGTQISGHVDVEKFTQNIEKAKELLKEAGYENGFKTKIWTSDQPVRRDIAVILQDQLKQVGIDVTIEILEWGAYLDGTARGDHEMFLLGWTTVTRDPDYGVYQLVSTNSQGSAGNRTFYSNQKVDELLMAGKTELDPVKRNEIYKEIQEIIRKDIPMYMMVYPMQAVATQKNVKGFKLGTAHSFEIYEVSIEQ